MKRKWIKFIIFAIVFFFIGIIIWKKINHKSTDEIFQEKTELFYENQDGFEKIVEYVSGFDFRSITENNEIRTEVMVNGIMFRLSEWESDYVLSLYPKKELLSQLMNNDEKEFILRVIGESSRMSVGYDKKSYNIVVIRFSIKDKRLENIMANLVWHNSDYEPMADWVYFLDDNWLIECMGLGKVK